MSGLLLKDLYILKKYGKTMVALILFFSLFAVFSKDAGFLSGMIIFVGTTMAINSFSYDDLSKWAKLCLGHAGKTAHSGACKISFHPDFGGGLHFVFRCFKRYFRPCAPQH